MPWLDSAGNEYPERRKKQWPSALWRQFIMAGYTEGHTRARFFGLLVAGGDLRQRWPGARLDAVATWPRAVKLPQRFKQADADRHRQVERPYVCSQDRNLNELAARFSDLVVRLQRQAGRLGPKEQPVARLVRKLCAARPPGVACFGVRGRRQWSFEGGAWDAVECVQD